METVTDFHFLDSKITADDDCSHEIKTLAPWKKSYDGILKSRDITLLSKVYLVKAVIFSSTHVWMWELDYKESWVPKNWCFWTVVLEKTLQSPLACKEIQPVHPGGNQSWIFTVNCHCCDYITTMNIVVIGIVIIISFYVFQGSPLLGLLFSNFMHIPFLPF